MTQIRSIQALEEHYATVDKNSLAKVANTITPEYRAWIEAAQFCIVSTVGPGGTDGSPRGDEGPVVSILDENTLLLPDWRGNNRLDTLRNIVEDGRISLMFIVSGKNNVIRVNGHATLWDDADLKAWFERKNGDLPRLVVKIAIQEIYSQCARAFVRSRLWSAPYDGDLPTMGDILRERTAGQVDAETYDTNWAARAQKTLWVDP